MPIKDETALHSLARGIYGHHMDALGVVVFNFFCNLTQEQRQIYFDAAQEITSKWEKIDQSSVA